jgi:hypothetical protein
VTGCASGILPNNILPPPRHGMIPIHHWEWIPAISWVATRDEAGRSRRVRRTMSALSLSCCWCSWSRWCWRLPDFYFVVVIAGAPVSPHDGCVDLFNMSIKGPDGHPVGNPLRIQSGCGLLHVRHVVIGLLFNGLKKILPFCERLSRFPRPRLPTHA